MSLLPQLTWSRCNQPIISYQFWYWQYLTRSLHLRTWGAEGYTVWVGFLWLPLLYPLLDTYEGQSGVSPTYLFGLRRNACRVNVCHFWGTTTLLVSLWHVSLITFSGLIPKIIWVNAYFINMERTEIIVYIKKLGNYKSLKDNHHQIFPTYRFLYKKKFLL